MIGVFCFSEDTAFTGIVDRIHVFANEQDALDWQIEQLVERGLIIDCGRDNYQTTDREPLGDSKLEALERWQFTCESLAFFHQYAVESHICNRS